MWRLFTVIEFREPNGSFPLRPNFLFRVAPHSVQETQPWHVAARVDRYLSDVLSPKGLGPTGLLLEGADPSTKMAQFLVLLTL